MSHFLQRARAHLSDRTSAHRQIAAGFLLVGGFVLVGKLSGAAKEMVIAAKYGVSGLVDAYVLAFSLVTFPAALMISVLTMVLVPVLAQLRSNRADELPRFRAELLALVLTCSVIVGIICRWGLPALIDLGWLPVEGSARAQTRSMVASLALLGPVAVLISLFSVWTLAEGKHRNTLFEAIPAAVLVLALLAVDQPSAAPLIWGTIAGLSLQLAALSAPAFARGQVALPRFGMSSPGWQMNWRGVAVLVAGQTAMAGSQLVDQLFAADLPVGSISVLSYANRIVALILGISALAITRSSIAVFSARPDESVRLSHHWAGIFFALGVALALVMGVLSPTAVSLLFERGAFGPSETQSVSHVLQMGLVQLPFYLAAIVYYSALASRGRHTTLGVAMLVSLAVKVAGNVALAPGLGLAGLQLATALMHACFLITLTLRIK
jgi:putative peptidoglycan lipid II flippase